MKSENLRVIEIANQYENKIRNEFCGYVDFNKVCDMTTNVFLLSDSDCAGEHEDLLYNAGKCVILTGDIFIKSKEIISDRTFVHEYIHRISRNRINDIWYMGLQAEDDGIRISLNEAITEYFCWKIVGYDERNPEVAYTFGINYIGLLEKKIGSTILYDLFFNSNLDTLKKCILNYEELSNSLYVLFTDAVIVNRIAAMSILNDALK